MYSMGKGSREWHGDNMQSDHTCTGGRHTDPLYSTAPATLYADVPSDVLSMLQCAVVVGSLSPSCKSVVTVRLYNPVRSNHRQVQQSEREAYSLVCYRISPEMQACGRIRHTRTHLAPPPLLVTAESGTPHVWLAMGRAGCLS
jgi:hypothetical protein